MSLFDCESNYQENKNYLAALTTCQFVVHLNTVSR